MVAGYLAKEFVEKGGRSGDLAIISADDDPPDFYDQQCIDLKTRIRIASINAAERKRGCCDWGWLHRDEGSFRTCGRGIETTMLVRDDRMGNVSFTSEMSEFIRKHYLDHGRVRVVTRTAFASVESESSARIHHERS